MTLFKNRRLDAERTKRKTALRERFLKLTLHWYPKKKSETVNSGKKKNPMKNASFIAMAIAMDLFCNCK